MPLSYGAPRSASHCLFMATASSPPPVFPARDLVDWRSIDTVLLDMDGTLLDLRFDNFFWLELIPEHFADRHGMSFDAAREALAPRFAAKQGTLDWYCTDFWSRELSLDVAGLKRAARHGVRFLPGAEAFLAGLKRRGVTTLLVTNAHRDVLAVKTEQTGLGRYVDAMASSHSFGFPKEDVRFWEPFQAKFNIDPGRSLFIDDSLPVLRAARAHGIGHLIAVSRPDSTLPARMIDEFSAIESLVQLLDRD
jgi:5'-nucleotidase